ncbi:MAG: hypothetical protein LBI79_07115 [Nitrososphaerota archaeon]|nr:hypothetical protein [Nitrososphaerota archaeon]
MNRPDLLFVSPPTGFYIHRINRNPTITTLEVAAPTPQQSLWLQQLVQKRLSNGSTVIQLSQVALK